MSPVTALRLMRLSAHFEISVGEVIDRLVQQKTAELLADMKPAEAASFMLLSQRKDASNEQDA